MGIEYFMGRWTEYAQWFYYRTWEHSELVSLGLIAACVLVAVVNGRQNIRRLRASDPYESAQDFRSL